MTKKQTPNEHHVVPNPKGGWDVERAGAQRASSHHSTKAEAVDSARQVSRNQKSELVIHNEDGRIGQKDSHGHDSKKSKG